MTDRLKDLYDQQGQSPWLDNLRRGYLTSGELAALRDRGVRGLTSNPSIFQKAIQGSSDYDEQFTDLVKSGASIDDDYWSLVIQDIHGACDVFERVYDESDGIDGYVSVEVAPNLAHDGPGTETAARALHERINRRNLMVKIPGTAEGLRPIEQMIAEGRCINVTLIFSLERYTEVMEAYIRGLERQVAERSHVDLSKVASVASFFISRVDTEVDRRLDAHRIRRGVGAARQGRRRPGQTGLSAVPRYVPWPALGRPGCPRRPRAAAALGIDVDEEPRLPRHALRGRAHRPAHGEHPSRHHARGLRRPWQPQPPGRCRRRRCARAVWAALAEVGVDMADVAAQLEREGVSSFEKAFDELITALETKASELR